MLAQAKSQSVQVEEGLYTPIIIDDSLVYPETFASHFHFADEFPDGLLAKSASILSMSGYEKPHPSDLLGLDTARSSVASSYGTYQPAPYMAQLPVPSHPQSDISDAETARYVTDGDLFSEATFESRRSSVANPVPTVTSYTPRSGRAGFNVFVTIESPFDVYSVPPTVFSILFASKRCSCTMEVLEPSGGHFNYVLAVEIPQFGHTSWHSLSVPLRLVMEAEGQPSQSVAFGTFTYDEVPPTSPEQSSRKRKASEDNEITQQPTKKPSTQSLSIKQSQDAFAYNQQMSTSPYSPFLPTPTSGNMYTTVKTPQMSSPNPMIRQASGISNPSQAAMRIPSPQTPSWSPPYSSTNRPVRSPALAVTTARHTAVATQSSHANPPLIRTSTIQHPPSSVNLGMTTQPGQSFNPYAMYPHKAVLKLTGNLDSMVDDWTPKEWEAKRRLVQFTRRQNGSTIRADFKPVTPEERPPNSICISCIYWEGKDECFVTSVDTIYLLESLVAVRFTVEEKNRIRRNLEGFRPLTVSKAKADSEDFFKVIMGFPNPKPRNIEKDVKVFPWKILSHALKKIIGKYSASYSSTAGSLVTPMSSTYVTSGMPEDHHLGHRNPSPQLISDPSNPNAYASITPTTSPGMMSEYRPNSITSMSYPYAPVPAPAYSYQPMRSHNGMPGPMAAPVPRGAWGYEHFVNPAITAAPLPPTTQQGYYAPPVTYAAGHPTSGI